MKKLILLSILCSLSFTQKFSIDTIAVEIQHNSERGEIEKMLLLLRHEKSPLQAAFLSLIPTLGHSYLEENWERTFISILWLSPAISVPFLSLASSDESEIWRGIYSTIGIIAFIPWYSLSMQDAYYLALQHNADLYKEIYGREYIRPPKKSLIQKWIDKKEAKKSKPE